MSAIGLRERKKAATKQALSRAAIRLAAERGLAGATAEAIAAQVGVSTRTFHNYFPAKEDAILYCAEDDVAEWVRILLDRPAAEPIWEALEFVTVGFVGDPERELDEVSLVWQLIEESPVLAARSHSLHARIGRRLGVAIAERTGTDIERDLYPNLMQTVVVCAVKTALEFALSSGREPADLIHEVFAQLRNGLPQPPVR
ncbi:TetR family transcriptional regulator [Skermania piniformis]|nr:TetR family transcriptional regulator [Skermania piniformis]